MATLLWVRDHYDTDHSRYIEASERAEAARDYMYDDIITLDDYKSVNAAYEGHTLLPAYTPGGTHNISVNIPSGSTLIVDGVSRL